MTNDDALNAICPYFTMFPLSFPLNVLRGGGRGLVVDPFCGRGTTNLAARLKGCPTVAIDSSPVGVAVASAKLLPKTISPEDIVQHARNLLSNGSKTKLPSGEFWERAFDPDVLRQVCTIRHGLTASRRDESKALRAIMLGALHGPTRVDGSSSYFSNQAPRTFAPKPSYALSFWRKRNLRPPKIDVLDIIRVRARRAFAHKLPAVKHRAQRADSRSADWSNILHGMGAIKWIITSPPYYGLRTYRPDQWLREWFLGGAPDVDYTAAGQVSHRSPDEFANDLWRVWSALAVRSDDDARMVIRFGAINDRFVDPEDLVRESLDDSGWLVTRIQPAGHANAGKRQARSFQGTLSAPIDEIDVWCRRAR